MSRIEKLAIRGIRSFDPQEEIKIEFFQPLTLIQGHNGSGKTVTINNLDHHRMSQNGKLWQLTASSHKR
jgi:DNA repair protein RAD50